MSTLEVRPEYSLEELKQLYPDSLQLKFVQVLFRHGERTPVSTRFQNEGVPAFWPFCASAAAFRSAILTANGPGDWSHLNYRRRVETYGNNGEAVIAGGRSPDDSEKICLLGELTDVGRSTTLALGQRMRNLYVNQLGFLPPNLTTESAARDVYLRASPVTRSLTSLQQVFTGLYPQASSKESPIEVAIHSRFTPEENLFPNDANCRRFNQLARAFAEIAAAKWNNSEDMAYLQKKIGKYVDGPVAVDGRPRLSGIMDTVNSTFAHGPLVKLPKEFYDPKVREIMNRINVDEWFRGYSQSSEYRRLGVGSLLGNMKDRLLAVAAKSDPLKIALYGAHDTTVAAMLASLGAFDGQWPPYTSNVAVELFSGPKQDSAPVKVADEHADKSLAAGTRKSWGWDSWFGGNKVSQPRNDDVDATKLEGWYVRLRYNDKPVVVQGCRPAGRHLDGDESFCTLAAFKSIVEKMQPDDWRGECQANLDKPGIPKEEPLD